MRYSSFTSSFTSGSKLLFVHLFVHLFVQVLNIDTGEAKNSTILNDYAKHPNDAERHQDAWFSTLRTGRAPLSATNTVLKRHTI